MGISLWTLRKRALPRKTPDSLFLAWATRFPAGEISDIPDKIVNVFLQAATAARSSSISATMTLAPRMARRYGVVFDLREADKNDRVGSRRLRTVTLPHHRTCRFQHPAVEPRSSLSVVGTRRLSLACPRSG